MSHRRRWTRDCFDMAPIGRNTVQLPDGTVEAWHVYQAHKGPRAVVTCPAVGTGGLQLYHGTSLALSYLLPSAVTVMPGSPDPLSAEQESVVQHRWASQHPLDFPDQRLAVVPRLVSRIGLEFSRKHRIKDNLPLLCMVGETLRLRDYAGAPWRYGDRVVLATYLMQEASCGLQDGVRELVAGDASAAAALLPDAAFELFEPVIQAVVLGLPAEERPLRLSATDVVVEALRFLLRDLETVLVGQPPPLAPTVLPL